MGSHFTRFLPKKSNSQRNVKNTYRSNPENKFLVPESEVSSQFFKTTRSESQDHTNQMFKVEPKVDYLGEEVKISLAEAFNNILQASKIGKGKKIDVNNTVCCTLSDEKRKLIENWLEESFGMNVEPHYPDYFSYLTDEENSELYELFDEISCDSDTLNTNRVLKMSDENFEGCYEITDTDDSTWTRIYRGDIKKGVKNLVLQERARRSRIEGEILQNKLMKDRKEAEDKKNRIRELEKIVENKMKFKIADDIDNEIIDKGIENEIIHKSDKHETIKNSKANEKIANRNIKNKKEVSNIEKNKIRNQKIKDEYSSKRKNLENTIKKSSGNDALKQENIVAKIVKPEEIVPENKINTEKTQSDKIVANQTQKCLELPKELNLADTKLQVNKQNSSRRFQIPFCSLRSSIGHFSGKLSKLGEKCDLKMSKKKDWEQSFIKSDFRGFCGNNNCICKEYYNIIDERYREPKLFFDLFELEETACSTDSSVSTLVPVEKNKKQITYSNEDGNSKSGEMLMESIFIS